MPRFTVRDAHVCRRAVAILRLATRLIAALSTEFLFVLVPARAEIAPPVPVLSGLSVATATGRPANVDPVSGRVVLIPRHTPLSMTTFNDATFITVSRAIACNPSSRARRTDPMGITPTPLEITHVEVAVTQAVTLDLVRSQQPLVLYLRPADEDSRNSPPGHAHECYARVIQLIALDPDRPLP